jgi:hypothetical protein
MADPLADVLIGTCHHVDVHGGMGTDDGVLVSTPCVPCASDRE